MDTQSKKTIPGLFGRLLQPSFEGTPRINVVISLEEIYLDQIKQGIKKYEYRRKFINQATTAFLYVNSPVKQVKAYAVFDNPIIGKPAEIADLAEKQVKGIGREIYEYMADLNIGYAMPIKKLVEFKPADLRFLQEHYDFTAPQGYAILDKKPKLLDFLLSRPIMAEWPTQ